MAEYGVLLLDKPHDLNAMRNVGWSSDIDIPGKNMYQFLYAQETVNFISKTVLKHLSPICKNITIHDEQIREMTNSVWQAEKGRDTANIFTKDTFELGGNSNNNNFYNRIVGITIQSIISQIRDQHEMAEVNNSLNIWNSLYGDFNEAGLRAHPKIKLRENHPQYMAFNMNY
jgi:hypothetical protein